MKKISVLIFVIFLFSASILADIPPPPVGEQIQIELQQNYPDYQFYIASYDLKVVPNPNPPHPSRPDMVVNIPDTFKLRQIDLSAEKPLIEAITSARIQNRGTLVGKNLWLVAVKKALAGAGGIESKIKDVIDNQTKVDGISAAYLTQSLESRKDEAKGAKLIINKVTKIDDQGLVMEVSEGTMAGLSGKVSSCIGAGLFLTGIAFMGFWWTRKRVK